MLYPLSYGGECEAGRILPAFDGVLFQVRRFIAGSSHSRVTAATLSSTVSQ